MRSRVSEVATHFAERAAGYAQQENWVNDTETLVPIVGLLQRKPGGIVMDVGAGTGAVASAGGSRSLSGDKFIGVDVAHSMLLQHARHSPAVVGDAHRLPFADSRADIIVCRQSIHYFECPDVVLAEIKRVLAFDGQLLIAQIVPFEDPEDQDWWKTAVALRQPLRRHRWTGAELVESLSRAGFIIESIQDLRRRTSMKGWLNRYPLTSDARQKLLDHFGSTPASVRQLRDFTVIGDAIEYSLRWIFITARPSDAVSASDAETLNHVVPEG
jgi:ubiquinone/menaquinone biosynthesis C-methylase UbiE